MLLPGDATISEMIPSTGPELGGTVVTVNGDGFISSQLSICRFGSRDAASISFASSTRLQCTSPPGTGVATLSIALNGQNFVAAFVENFDFHYRGT